MYSFQVHPVARAEQIIFKSFHLRGMMSGSNYKDVRTIISFIHTKIFTNNFFLL